MSLGSRWRELHASPGVHSDVLGVPTIALDARSIHGNVRLALGSKGERRMLVPMGLSEAVPAGLGGLHLVVSSTRLKQGGKLINFLDVVCSDERLEEVFGRFVEEVARRANSGVHPVESLRQVLEEYRDLFAIARASGPDLRELLGLLGELVVLDRIMEMVPGDANAWVGITSGRHDFASGTVALEVKTSLVRDARRVHISSLEQLSAQPGHRLYLLHHAVEENASGPLSVPELAGRALDRSKDRAGLAERLEGRGYDHQAPGTWGARRFDLVETAMYEVRHGFPRIIPPMIDGGIPAGVMELGYEIDLGVAAPFRSSEEAIEAVLLELGRR